MKKNKLLKILSILLCLSLIFEQTGFAQVAGQLDISGHLAAFRNSFAPDTFRPLHLRYLSYDSLNNNFRLFLDKGSLKNPKSQEVEKTTKELLNYFFVGITLPNDAFWVNLRPDAETNIIDEQLAQTDVGRVLLESDLQLKKDTAKFTSPETPEGRQYWDKLYQKAGEIFGSQNITIPTLTRPWIVPDEIIIRETTDSAYIYKATLKVMLEQDYLKGSAIYNFEDDRLKELNEYSSQLIREIIIPKLTQEINASKRYAQLRQVYYSLIMAQWFKARFTNQPGLYSRIIDRRVVFPALYSKGSWSKTTYFQAYQKSFKDGEYNIQEPVYSVFGQTIRSYFSGGEIFDLGRMPQLGQAAVNPTTGSTISSIPTAALPAVNPNVVVGVEVGTTAEPGELTQIKITGQAATADQDSDTEILPETLSSGVSAEAQAGEFDLQSRAGVVLGRSLSDEEAVAIQRAHDVGQGHYLGKQNSDGTYEKNEDSNLAYTPQEIAQKTRILKAAGFTEEERRKLIKYGIAGSPISEDTFFNADLLRKYSSVFKEIQYVNIAKPKEEVFKNLISEIKLKDFIIPQILGGQWGISGPSSEKILSDLVDDFLKLIGASLPEDKAQEIKAKIKDLLEQDFFASLQDISRFERALKIYESRVNGLFNDFGITASHPERIAPVLVRMGMWAKSLGLIDTANIQGIPGAPRKLTVGIATKALAGLGDITKIAMIVNGLFEEFDNRGVDLHIKVFVFAEDAGKMETIEKGLRDKLGNYARKNGTTGTLEIIPIRGNNATLTVGDPQLNDVNVFITLVRPVREALTLPREVSPMARVPRVCFTLGEYDSMVPPNPRMRSVSLFEVKTGFADDSVGFFVNPYTEELYQRVHAASRSELSSMRQALLEDIIIEIWLESYKRAFLADAAVAPTEEELGREMDLEAVRCRSRLSTLRSAIQQANSSSQWAVLYMHHEGIKYLQALQRLRQQRNSQDSVTIFTFFGERNREAVSINEWEELKEKARNEGLPFEFYDLSTDPSQLASIDFTKPAVRVINLGMRSLEANIRSMALSDLPVGVTGDESLLTALTLRKPVLYEVMSWKRSLFAALLRRVKEVDNPDAGAETALRNFNEGNLNREVAALFDAQGSVVGVFSRLGDLVAGMKLYPGLVPQMFNHIALENFFAELLERYPLDASLEAGEEGATITAYDSYFSALKSQPYFTLLASSWKEKLDANLYNYGKAEFIQIKEFKPIEFKMEKIVMLDFGQAILNYLQTTKLSLGQWTMVQLAKLLRGVGLKKHGNAILFGIAQKLKIGQDEQASSPIDEADLRKRAEEALGRSVSEEEFAAIKKAHEVGQGHYLGKQNSDGTYEKNEDPNLAYTAQEIWQKARILKGAGFNEDERRKLIKYGVAGVFDWFKSRVTAEQLVGKYQNAITRQDEVGIYEVISESKKLGSSERLTFLLEIININDPAIVNSVTKELQAILTSDANLDRRATINKLRERLEVWRTHGFDEVVNTLSDALLALGEPSQQKAPVKQADVVERGNGAGEFRNYVDRLKNGRVSFNLQISGDEAASQLRLGREFALLYDELLKQVNAELLRKGKIDIDRVIALADSIAAKQGARGDKEETPTVTLAIKKIQDNLEGNVNDSSIDRALNEFENTIRERLSRGQVSSREAGQAVSKINDFLIPRGYLVEQSPLGLSDGRVFILYKIVEQEVSDTPQGNVRVFFVRQVTQFPDGLLRGNPGWSSYFTDYVVVFRGMIERSDQDKTEGALRGEAPFRATDAHSYTGRQINRMADICVALLRRGFSGLSSSQRQRLQEESTRIHETEHEIRRRALDLKEGDIVNGLLEEALAELRSLRDSNDPWHVLSHIVELAAGDTSFAWLVLERLSGYTNRDEIISWLERISNQDSSQIKQAAEIAYREMSSSPSVSSNGIGDERQTNRNILAGVLKIATTQKLITEDEAGNRLREFDAGLRTDTGNDIDLQVDNKDVFLVNGQKVIVIDKDYLSTTEEGEQYASAGLRRGVIYITRAKFQEWQQQGILEQKIKHEQDEVAYLHRKALEMFPGLNETTAYELLSNFLKNPNNTKEARDLISEAHNYAKAQEVNPPQGNMDDKTSSPLKGNRPARLPLTSEGVKAPGGIDFRNLPIVTQAVGNLSANIGSSSLNRFNNINLNSEWRDIENLVNSGIIPSAERIKGYVQASCYKGSVDRDIDKVISCISDILRIEEERYSPTDPTLKDILVVLDSANSVQQLRAVFIGTTP